MTGTGPESSRASLSIEARVDDQLTAELRRMGLSVEQFGTQADAALTVADQAVTSAQQEFVELGATVDAQTAAVAADVERMGREFRETGQTSAAAFDATERQLVETGAVVDQETAQWVAGLNAVERESREAGAASERLGQQAERALEGVGRESREAARDTQVFGARADRSFDLARRSAQALGTTVGVIRRGIGLLTPGLGSLTAGLGGLFIVGGATRGAAEFGAAIAEVQTLIGEATEDTAGLRDEVRGIARDLGLNEVEQAKALYQTLSSDISLAAGALQFLEESSRFAIAGVTDQASAVDLLVTAVRLFDKDVSDARAVADGFFATVKAGRTTIPELAASFGQAAPLAAALGAQLEEVNAGLATITAIGGGNTSEAATQIAALFRGLLNNADEIDAAFQTVGQRFDETTVRTLGVAGTIEVLTEATGGSAQALLELLGRAEAVNAVLNLSGPNLERYRRTLESIRGAQGASDAAFGTIFESDAFQARRALNALRLDVQGIGDTILAEVARISRESGGLEEFLAPLGVAVDGFGQVASIGIARLRDFVADVNQSIEELGGADAAAERLGTGFALFGSTVALAAQVVVGGIAEIGSAVFQFLGLTQDLGAFDASRLVLGGSTFGELREALETELVALEEQAQRLRDTVADPLAGQGGAFGINELFLDEAEFERYRAKAQEQLEAVEQDIVRVRGRIAAIGDERLDDTLLAGVGDFLEGLRQSTEEYAELAAKLTQPLTASRDVSGFEAQIAAAQATTEELGRIYGERASRVRQDIARALDAGDLLRAGQLEIALLLNTREAREALDGVRAEVERLKEERIDLALGSIPDEIEALREQELTLQATVALAPADLDEQIRRELERGGPDSRKLEALVALRADTREAEQALARVGAELRRLEALRVEVEASIEPLDTSAFLADADFDALGRELLAGLQGPTVQAAQAAGIAAAFAFSAGFGRGATSVADEAAPIAEAVERVVETSQAGLRRLAASAVALGAQLAALGLEGSAVNRAALAFAATQGDAISSYIQAVDRQIQAELERQAALGATDEELRQVALQLRLLAREGDQAFGEGFTTGLEDFARFARDDFRAGVDLARASVDALGRAGSDALFAWVSGTGSARDALRGLLEDIGRLATQTLVTQALGRGLGALGFGAQDTGEDPGAEALVQGAAAAAASLTGGASTASTSLQLGGQLAGQALISAATTAAAILAGSSAASSVAGLPVSILGAGAGANAGIIQGGTAAGPSILPFAEGGVTGALSGMSPVSGHEASGLLGGALPVRGYATGGGIVSSPHLAIIGEGTSKEAVVPLPDGRTIPVRFQGEPGAQPDAGAALGGADMQLAAAALLGAAGALMRAGEGLEVGVPDVAALGIGAVSGATGEAAPVAAQAREVVREILPAIQGRATAAASPSAAVSARAAAASPAPTREFVLAGLPSIPTSDAAGSVARGAAAGGGLPAPRPTSTTRADRLAALAPSPTASPRRESEGERRRDEEREAAAPAFTVSAPITLNLTMQAPPAQGGAGTGQRGASPASSFRNDTQQQRELARLIEDMVRSSAYRGLNEAIAEASRRGRT